MPLNSFLKRILASTGLTRRGRLAEATKVIQQALSAATATRPQPAPVRAESAATAPGFADVLDDGVRETEPEPLAATSLVDTGEIVELEPPVPAARRGAGQFIESSFTGAAGTRAFKLFEPAGFEGRALPLVVMLHGCSQDPDDFAAGTRMNVLAQEQGLFVLYPAQAPRSNMHKCWNWFVPGDQRRGRGEPALIAGMTRHVMETHVVDPDRVYVAGLSAGGAMAAILAREYPDLYAAAGIHSGLAAGSAHDVASAFTAMKSGPAASPPAWPDFGTAALRPTLAAWPAAAPPEVESVGDASRGAPLIVFHGDADATVNHVNGSHVIDAALGAAAWEATRDAPADPGAGNGDRVFTRTVYRAGGAAREAPGHAEHWVVHGAGHAWSGGDDSGSFTDSAGPDASREMLRFFAEHPRSAAV